MDLSLVPSLAERQFMASLKTTAIIVAAGKGKRFGVGVKKQFQLLSGKPVIAHSIGCFEKSDSIGEIVLVVPEDSIDYCRKEIVEKFGFKKVTKVVPGGEERQDSVEKGFNSVSEDVDLVLIHDGVRPFVTLQLIDAVIKEAARSGAAIIAMPAKDTVKKISADGFIESTIPREFIWLAQTPQAFRYDVLKKAYGRIKGRASKFTDESSLVEEVGVRVKLVKGSLLNIKITTEEDLLLGELILKEGIYKNEIE
jgi:2-C-methyl-D-erythritol 4-phosphate cytidylyltransferase